jgi:hypothetical protein
MFKKNKNYREYYKMKDELLHFTIGSSVFIMIYPLVLLYNAHKHMSQEEIDNTTYGLSLEMIIFGLPIAFGLLFAFLYKFLTIIPRKYEEIYVRFILTGVLTAVTLSLILDYVFDVPHQWLHIDNTLGFHLGVMVFYFVVFYVIGVWLRTQIIYGSTADYLKAIAPSSGSSSGSSSSKMSSVAPNVMTNPLLSNTISNAKADSMAKFNQIAQANK